MMERHTEWSRAASEPALAGRTVPEQTNVGTMLTPIGRQLSCSRTDAERRQSRVGVSDLERVDRNPSGVNGTSRSASSA